MKTCKICGSDHWNKDSHNAPSFGAYKICESCLEWAVGVLDDASEDRGWDQLPLSPLDDMWREELSASVFS